MGVSLYLNIYTVPFSKESENNLSILFRKLSTKDAAAVAPEQSQVAVVDTGAAVAKAVDVPLQATQRRAPPAPPISAKKHHDFTGESLTKEKVLEIAKVFHDIETARIMNGIEKDDESVLHHLLDELPALRSLALRQPCASEEEIKDYIQKNELINPRKWFYFQEPKNARSMKMWNAFYSASFVQSKLVTNDYVASLAEYEQLEDINLSGCERITDRALKALAEMPRLRVLDISKCSELAKKPHLHKQGAKVTTAVDHICAMVSLQKLTISRSEVFDDAALKRLQAIKGLNISIVA